jgi:hypothetical protein
MIFVVRQVDTKIKTILEKLQSEDFDFVHERLPENPRRPDFPKFSAAGRAVPVWRLHIENDFLTDTFLY